MLADLSVAKILQLYFIYSSARLQRLLLAVITCLHTDSRQAVSISAFSKNILVCVKLGIFVREVGPPTPSDKLSKKLHSDEFF